MTHHPSVSRAARQTAFLAGLLLATGAMLAPAQEPPANTAADPPKNAPVTTMKASGKKDARAVKLLEETKAKLRSVRSLTVDFEGNNTEYDLEDQNFPTRKFARARVLALERPNRFRIERISGVLVEARLPEAVSNGQTVSTFHRLGHVAYEKPLRPENFFLGHNFLIQVFFDPAGIRFDPNDALWARPTSQFDPNLTAYDKDTRIGYVGERTLEDARYEVVEIKYNTRVNDIRQQFYIGGDRLIYQVDTYLDGKVYSQKFRNYNTNIALSAKTWDKSTADKMPVVQSDPIRLGQPAPEFALPGADGKEYTLKQLLEGKRGVYICTLNANDPEVVHDPDYHLEQMRWLQHMKNHYEKQGLAVVAIAGHETVTPEMKDEVIVNRLPDLRRFGYPVLVDIDIERGLQGSAYQNFNLNGRNNILLDSKGRVVFAAKNFYDKANLLGFFQTLAQLGFKVSPAEMEMATFEDQQYDFDKVK